MLYGSFSARGPAVLRLTNRSAGSDREPAHAAWQSESTSWHVQASELICRSLRFRCTARRDTRDGRPHGVQLCGGGPCVSDVAPKLHRTKSFNAKTKSCNAKTKEWRHERKP